MQISADALLDGPFPVGVEHLQEAASVADWIVILDRLLSTTRHIFIVLDPDLLSHMTAYEPGTASINQASNT